jgi:endo-1,4-beta-mannosidase
MQNFFTDPKAIDAFKNHISFMSNRTNSVNGVKYSDDPTIFSWNLMNEPRFFGNDTTCQNDAKKCQDEFQSW